jgi:hypothetical protein
VVRLVALLLTVSAAASAAAQSQSTSRLAVFLDCHTNCDFDLIREEIAYVDWLRDRTSADVHLLITSQGAGQAGRVHGHVLGLRSMTGKADTCVSRPTLRRHRMSDAVSSQTIAAGLRRCARHSARRC